MLDDEDAEFDLATDASKKVAARFDWVAAWFAFIVHASAVIAYTIARYDFKYASGELEGWDYWMIVDGVALFAVSVTHPICLGLKNYFGVSWQNFDTIATAIEFIIFGGLQWFYIFGRILGYTHTLRQQAKRSEPKLEGPFED